MYCIVKPHIAVSIRGSSYREFESGPFCLPEVFLNSVAANSVASATPESRPSTFGTCPCVIQYSGSMIPSRGLRPSSHIFKGFSHRLPATARGRNVSESTWPIICIVITNCRILVYFNRTSTAINPTKSPRFSSPQSAMALASLYLPAEGGFTGITICVDSSHRPH